MNNKAYKVAVFPYDYESFPIIKYRNELEKFEVVKIFSLKGWGGVGKGALEIGKDDSKDELIVQDIFDDLKTDQFDTLWLVESEHTLEDSFLFECIEKMVENKIKLFISRKLTKDQLMRIKEICKKEKVHTLLTEEEDEYFADGDEQIYNLYTPVISIAGIGQKANKMELQLEVYSRLKQDGYQVCWIASRKEAVLFGGETFPQFMIESSLSEKDKILKYNHYLKLLEQERKPDVFLIGIPGGIMPITKRHVGNFGIYAYEIFNAVTPDFTIVSLYYSSFKKEYLEELEKLMKYKFSVEVDCFNVSNIEQDAFSMGSILPIEYVMWENKELKDKIEEIEAGEFPLFNRMTYESMYQYMIEQLNGYDELKEIY